MTFIFLAVLALRDLRRARASFALYLTWSAVFLYIMFDDLLMIHERWGNTLTAQFGFVPRFGLRAKDFGELAATAIVGTILLAAIAAAYVWSEKAARSCTRMMALLMLALAGFGVFFDMVHVMVINDPVLEPVLGMLEDGGEMLVMSLMVRFVLRTWWVHRRDFETGAAAVGR